MLLPVSSYATVHLADGREVCSFRGGVDQLFFILFTKDERFTETDDVAYQLLKDTYVDLEPDECVAVGFRTTAGAVRDRLDLLGIDEVALQLALEEIVAERRASNLKMRELFPSDILADHREREEAALAEVTWGRWVNVVGPAIGSGKPLKEWGGKFDEGSAGWLMGLWEDLDERYAFGALLQVLDPAEQITLDLSQLDESWIEDSVDPQEFARSLVMWPPPAGCRRSY